MKSKRLSAAMTLREFDHGYWFAVELKTFATAVGIPSAGRLRKDELEKAIRRFLKSGEAPVPAPAKPAATGIPDTDRGLSLRLTVRNYKNDRATWNFIEVEAKRLHPDYRRKSGSRYRLNRWREEQLAKGARLTYGDLVRRYVSLSLTSGPFAQAPTGRYINFLSDFFAARKGAVREDGLRAWRQLKELDAPKTYRSWLKYCSGE